MDGTDELAEQKKEPTDDSGEPAMLPSQLQGAHDHRRYVEWSKRPLAARGKRIKRRALRGRKAVRRRRLDVARRQQVAD